MKKTLRQHILKWSLLLLFSTYMGGITFFTHTHIINRITYVHSHPFKKSEKQQHSHTKEQLLTLEYFYHTTIDTDIVPFFDFQVFNFPIHIYQFEIPEFIPTSENTNCNPLRAPPFKA